MQDPIRAPVDEPSISPPAFDPLRTRASLLIRLNTAGPEREIAWSEFYARYGALIARYAERSGATATEAQDVVQDVMTRFYSLQSTFTYTPQQGRFRSFLRVCARNATITRLRKRRREDTGARPADEAAGEIADDSNAPDPIWEELWDASQLRRAIEATQRRYSTNEQRARTFRAFELYVLLGQSANAVAERLGIGVESVHAAKTRVTKALREELAAINEEDSD